MARQVRERLSPVERWRTMPEDTRRQLAGDHLPKVLELLDRVDPPDGTPGLSDEERQQKIADTRRHLSDTVARLKSSEDHVRRLRAERAVSTIELALLGVPQAEIAAYAKVSSMIVGFAVGTAVKSPTPKTSRNP